MSLIINGVNLPGKNSSNFRARINYNGVSLSKIIFNGVTVWESGTESWWGDANKPQWTDSIHHMNDSNSYDVNKITGWSYQPTANPDHIYNYVRAYVRTTGNLVGSNAGSGPILILDPNIYDDDRPVIRTTNGVKYPLGNAESVGFGYWYKSQERGAGEGSNAKFEGWIVYSAD